MPRKSYQRNGWNQYRRERARHFAKRDLRPRHHGPSEGDTGHAIVVLGLISILLLLLSGGAKLVELFGALLWS